MKNSLKGGPCETFFKMCPTRGDVRWVYQRVKQWQGDGSFVSLGLDVIRMFNFDRSGQDLATVAFEVEAEAARLGRLSKRLGCAEGVVPEIWSRIIVMKAVLQSGADEEEVCEIEKVIEKLCRKRPMFGDDLLDKVEQRKVRILEIKRVKNETWTNEVRMKVNSARTQGPSGRKEERGRAGKGLCWYFQKGKCNRIDCRFIHDSVSDTAINSTGPPGGPGVQGGGNGTTASSGPSVNQGGHQGVNSRVDRGVPPSLVHRVSFVKRRIISQMNAFLSYVGIVEITGITMVVVR